MSPGSKNRVAGLGVTITGSGIYAPESTISNQELCAAFNHYARRENQRRAADIQAGRAQPLRESSSEFIVKASGIERRHVEDRTGILDPDRMCPNIRQRRDDQLSLQADYAVRAARAALERANRVAEDVDMILLAASNLERPYPAIGIEVQHALGARGFAFDLSVGCSSATFPLQVACDALRQGNATCALLVNPEVTSPYLNWRDRDSHFILGDASSALVIEAPGRQAAASEPGWEILATRLMSKFSNNIRNNGGYINRCDPATRFDADKLFYQQGRRVFKDIVPLASRFVADHLGSVGLAPDQVARYWLHQANGSMNEAIMKALLKRKPRRHEAPLVLDEYGNTASAGAVMAFHLHNQDLPAGSVGVLFTFGAGYSIGSAILRRL